MRPSLHTNRLGRRLGGGRGGVSSFERCPTPLNMDGLADRFNSGSKDLARPAAPASARQPVPKPGRARGAGRWPRRPPSGLRSQGQRSARRLARAPAPAAARCAPNRPMGIARDEEIRGDRSRAGQNEPPAREATRGPGCCRDPPAGRASGQTPGQPRAALSHGRTGPRSRARGGSGRRARPWRKGTLKFSLSLHCSSPR